MNERPYKLVNCIPKSTQPRCCPFVLRVTPGKSIDLDNFCCIPRIWLFKRPSDRFGHSCGSCDTGKWAASKIASVRNELRKIKWKLTYWRNIVTKLVEILLRNQHRELRHLVIWRVFTETSSARLQKFATALSFCVCASGSAHTIIRNGAKAYKEIKEVSNKLQEGKSSSKKGLTCGERVRSRASSRC